MSKKDRGRLQKPRVCDMEQKQLTYHTPLKKAIFVTHCLTSTYFTHFVVKNITLYAKAIDAGTRLCYI